MKCNIFQQEIKLEEACLARRKFENSSKDEERPENEAKQHDEIQKQDESVAQDESSKVITLN